MISKYILQSSNLHVTFIVDPCWCLNWVQIEVNACGLPHQIANRILVPCSYFFLYLQPTNTAFFHLKTFNSCVTNLLQKWWVGGDRLVLCCCADQRCGLCFQISFALPPHVITGFCANPKPNINRALRRRNCSQVRS